MRVHPLVSGCLSLVTLALIAAACLNERSPAVAVAAKGHEETSQLAAAPVAKPSPKADPAPVPAALPRIVAPLPGCRSIDERLASIVKAAPDAVLYQRFGPALADDYARSFNVIHGTRISADEVAVVVSSYWGDRALVLFEHKGCETGTEQVPLAAQG
jgi:hypothetical protein